MMPGPGSTAFERRPGSGGRQSRPSPVIVQVVMMATMVFALLDLYLLTSSLVHH
jgi:hypothetical protein